MRDKEYSKWLQPYVTYTVIGNYIKRCRRVEDNLHIDLDDEFIKDNGKSLLIKLTYTTDDQVHNRPLKCDIYFNAGSDLRAGMGSLKTAVSKYFEFCKEGVTPAVDKSFTVKTEKKEITTISTMIDSYQEFLTHFQIDRDSFFEWGISATIIEKDPTNNAVPHKLIQRITKLKRNRDIYNYQVSHIWGHTKNIFMFEAPWNICYTPKIMDPFTGHETQGIWPTEYQKIFIAKANELYRPFIDEYNQILKSLDVNKKLQEYILSLENLVPAKELEQFSKDAAGELSAI